MESLQHLVSSTKCWVNSCKVLIGCQAEEELKWPGADILRKSSLLACSKVRAQ